MLGLILNRFIDETAAVLEAEQKATLRALQKAAYEIFRAAQASIETSPTKSAPGKPPHSRKGQLRRAIRYDVDKTAGVAVIGPRRTVVGTSAMAHEFGGRYRREVHPERPFMGPALEKNVDRIPAFWSSEVHK